MNTDFDALEHRVTETLSRQVEHTIVRAAPDEVWSKAQAGRRRHRRVRQSLSVVCALAVLSAGFGVYKWQTKPQPTEVTFGEESDLHLIPTWLPEGNKMMLQDVSAHQFEDPNLAFVWKNKDQVINLMFNFTRGYGNGQNLDDAIRRSANLPMVGYLGWSIGDANINIAAAPPIKRADMEALARSVNVDATTNSVKTANPPFGLPLIYEGPAKPLNPTRYWYMFSTNGAGGVTVSASLPTPLSAKLFGPEGQYGSADGSAGGTVLTTVRGHDARQLAATGTTPDQYAFVYWRENGWDVSVRAKNAQDALRVANNLKVATQQEWEDFPRDTNGSTPVSPDERRKPSEVAATVDVGSSELKVFAGDLISEAGCVNIKLQGTGKDDKFCLKPTGRPVLWSGVRTIGGKKSVVAIVDLHVDSVALTNESGDASTQIVSARTINDETPAGFVVDTTQDGDKYTWLGVAALPFDGDSPGRIEAYFNTEFDREAPSAEAPDANGGAEAQSVDGQSGDGQSGDGTNEEYDAPLKSLGRFEVG